VWTYLTIASLFGGDSAQALALGERAFALAQEMDDLALRATARTPWGHALRERGDYRRSAALFGEAIAALSGDLVRERFGQAMPPSLYARNMAALCLADLGDFAEAERLGLESAALAQDMDLPFGLILARIALGHTWLVQGDLARADDILGQALEVIETRDLPAWFPWAAATRGYTWALSGRASGGAALLEQAIGRALALPFLFGHSLWVAWLAHAQLLAGRVDEAVRRGHEALRLSRQRGERGYEAWALLILGAVEAARGPDGKAMAEACTRQALALATDLGMAPLQAHCRRALGMAASP
jgi:tetratricopeptide (TPR) repeat protein